MAEGEAGGKGIGGFLKGSTGPLPNWAWGVVIVGGIAIAYFLPKFFGGKGTGSQTSSNTGTSDQSGLGLAIDPTTGLPYAVEGLVPSGGTVAGTGSGGATPVPPVPTPIPTPEPIPTPGPIQPTEPKNTAWTPLLSVWPRNIPVSYGQHITIGGITYVTGGGGSGRIWGVPIGNPASKTLAAWNNVPIEPGQKQLLYQPGSPALMPLTTQPTWPGGITQTRIGV